MNLLIAALIDIIMEAFKWFFGVLIWPFKAVRSSYRSLGITNRLLLLIFIVLFIQSTYMILDIVNMKIKYHLLLRMNKTLSDQIYMDDAERGQYSTFFEKEGILKAEQDKKRWRLPKIGLGGSDKVEGE